MSLREVKCTHCEEVYPENDMIPINADEYICENCEMEHYFYCDECHELHHRDDLKYYRTLEIIVCDDCGMEVPY